jgi:coenzyme F420-reducing hydrogenase gamma subunit
VGEVGAAVLRARQRQRPEVLDHVIILTAQRHGAELVAAQADERLTPEFAAALLEGSIVDAEAVF